MLAIAGIFPIAPIVVGGILVVRIVGVSAVALIYRIAILGTGRVYYIVSLIVAVYSSCVLRVVSANLVMCSVIIMIYNFPVVVGRFKGFNLLILSARTNVADITGFGTGRSKLLYFAVITAYLIGMLRIAFAYYVVRSVAVGRSYSPLVTERSYLVFGIAMSALAGINRRTAVLAVRSCRGNVIITGYVFSSVFGIVLTPFVVRSVVIGRYDFPIVILR